MKLNRPTPHVLRYALIGASCIAAATICFPAVAQSHARVTSTLNRTALNPQPLPPKTTLTPVDQIGSATAEQQRGIIIVGGRSAAELNPQPLPPKAQQSIAAPGNSAAQQRGIIIVGGKKARGAAAGR